MKIVSIGINDRGFIGRTQMEMLEWCVGKCLELKSLKPDMIVFPEVVFIMYPQCEPLSAEEFYMAAIKKISQTALEVSSYIVFNIHEPHETLDGFKYITTFVMNKSGEVAGKYRKMHPVDVEILESRVIPGSEPCVIDTEFGKIGIATCFDIGWRSYWQSLRDLGAKAVIWTSAYDGGNMLDAYAVMHMYWVISSVRTCRARIIDPAGRTVAESSPWDNVCFADVDLDMEVFHIDNQFQRIHKIRERLGDKAVIQTMAEENIFTVSSKDPEWPIDRIKAEFGLMTYSEYHAAADKIQVEYREKVLS